MKLFHPDFKAVNFTDMILCGIRINAFEEDQ